MIIFSILKAYTSSHFIEIMRSVYLKGANITDFWVQYTALSGFAMLFCLMATMTYRKRV